MQQIIYLKGANIRNSRHDNLVPDEVDNERMGFVVDHFLDYIPGANTVSGIYHFAENESNYAKLSMQVEAEHMLFKSELFINWKLPGGINVFINPGIAKEIMKNKGITQSSLSGDIQLFLNPELSADQIKYVEAGIETIRNVIYESMKNNDFQQQERSNQMDMLIRIGLRQP